MWKESSMPPRLQLTSVTISCPDPRALAAFYAELLGAEITASEPPLREDPEDAGWAQIRTFGEDSVVTLNFEHERHWTRPTWPSEPGKQHITEHLDINVEDLESAVSWALECGATLAAYQPQEDVRVCLDPDGHPFCLFT
jgi:catechol 2,3-dioxygenase-like lactoylglutathione lyase family enzyme